MRSLPKLLGRLVSAALVAAAVLLAAVMIVPAAMGMQRYVITGWSMTGTYDRGSVVFDRAVPTAQLKVGDVITYVPPRGAGPEGRVTHRIFAIRRIQGQRIFRTKGDNNARVDPWIFTLRAKSQPVVKAHVPYLGFAFMALAIRQLRMLIVGLPALLIAIGVIASLWKDAGEEVSRRSGAEPAES